MQSLCGSVRALLDSDTRLRLMRKIELCRPIWGDKPIYVAIVL